MKTKQTSPIPTTIDEQESVRNQGMYQNIIIIFRIQFLRSNSNKV